MSDKVQVLEVKEYIDDEGTLVQRIVFDVNGHDVQLVRLDHSEDLIVKVDSAVMELPVDQVDTFIRNRT